MLSLDPHAADRYHLVVYWSQEDDCWIGSAPSYSWAGTHGDDPVEVFKTLRGLVREEVKERIDKGEALPV